MTINLAPTPTDGSTPEHKYTTTPRALSKGPNSAGFDPRSMPPGTEVEGAAAPHKIGEAGERAPGEEKGDGDGKDPDAWRFAKLAEQARAIRARTDEAKKLEVRLKAAQEDMDKRMKALEDREKAHQDQQQRWRRDPKALLMDNGYSPEAALQFMLAGEKLSPEQALAANLDQRLSESERKQEERLAALRQEQAAAAEQERKEEEERAKEEATQKEQQAVEELQGEIAEILEGDLKSYPLIAKAEAKSKGRGVQAVYAKINELSDKQLDETGRRPLVTTRLMEKALQAIEEEARAELREAISDESVARAIGVSRPAPRQQTTVPTNPPRRGTQRVVEEEAPEHETATQHRMRVTQQIQAIFDARRGR